ncbi:hypothetical protein RQP46_007678 [Phenoliferia psychrophenolica]
MSSNLNIPPDQVEHALRVFAAAKTYLIKVVTCILCWDSLSTLATEIRYIWKAKLTPLKVAYLINRYWTFLAMIFSTILIIRGVPPGVCAKAAFFEPGSVIVTLMSCSTILTIRMHALFGRSARVLTFLCLLMLGELAVLCVATTQFEAIALPAGINGCVATGKQGNAGFITAFAAAPLAFDSVIVVMTIHRFVS